MNRHTWQDVADMNPCYDPELYVPKDWEGTALDGLKIDVIPPADKLWIVLHPGWLDQETIVRFLHWCFAKAKARVNSGRDKPVSKLKSKSVKPNRDKNLSEPAIRSREHDLATTLLALSYVDLDKTCTKEYAKAIAPYIDFDEAVDHLIKMLEDNA